MNMHSISGGKGELGDMVYEDKEYGQCPWARAREVGIALIKQRAKKEDTHNARGEHCTTMITSDLDIRIKADVFFAAAILSFQPQLGRTLQRRGIVLHVVVLLGEIMWVSLHLRMEMPSLSVWQRI